MIDKFNILIVGKGAVVGAIAKALKNNHRVDKIYATCKSDPNKLFESVDIREDDFESLLRFVLDYDVNFTVVTDKKAIKADVAGFFISNGQNIFAPTKEACRIAYDNIFGKKFLYRLHAQTAKFNIIEKSKPYYEMLSSLNFPLVVRDEKNYVCTTMKQVRELISYIFNDSMRSNLLVEEYVCDKNFTIYFFTDGYSILPITSVRNCYDESFKNITKCFVPDDRVSNLILSRATNIAISVINYLSQKDIPYCGILGMECSLTSSSQFYVNGFKPFFSDYDASAILTLLQDDFFDLILSCISGSFSDEYEHISLLPVVSGAVVESLKNSEPFNEDEIQYVDFNVETDSFVYSRKASTFGYLKKILDISSDNNYLV